MSSLDAMSFFPEAPPMSKDGTLLTHVPELCMADEEEGTSHSCATSCPQRTSGRVCRHHWAKGWIGGEGQGEGQGTPIMQLYRTA